jgi:hypothetical protein
MSELPWMPKKLLIDSKPYSSIVCSLMGVHFPNLPECPPRNQLESAEEMISDSDTNSETVVSAGVSVVTKGRAREATHALKRPQLEDQSDSHISPHLAPIQPASVMVEITSPVEGTRKRQKIRNGGKVFEHFTI